MWFEWKDFVQTFPLFLIRETMDDGSDVRSYLVKGKNETGQIIKHQKRGGEGGTKSNPTQTKTSFW